MKSYTARGVMVNKGQSITKECMEFQEFFDVNVLLLYMQSEEDNNYGEEEP